MALKFTKNQTLILGIFFSDPQKSYYLRQLGRIIGKEPGVFQKDINRLVESGILLSEYQANSRFFKLNKNHPLYPEFKSIFFKTLGAEGKLKKILGKIQNIKVVFIFGSFAKNKEDSFSDIDLMLIGNPDEDLLISKISKLESQLDREINYHIFSLTDWGKKLKEKDSFIENILAQPKIFLIGNKNELSRIR
ncbi:nucleotidyltransferase domain-containing protein [Patescibacteria group bacterium]|nr:nucleotidyltransferase domain-containing protein [Patescibacteria group bacterium]